MCCRGKCECDHLKPDSHECTPEQIRECHGDVAEHPCLRQDETAEHPAPQPG